ncbi:MAG: hypothetical protein Q9191_001360 [Dirinaria sp. TL-2023a]
MSPRWSLECLGEAVDIVLPYLLAFKATLPIDDATMFAGREREASIPLDQAAAFLSYLHNVQASRRVLSKVSYAFDQDLLSGRDIHSLKPILEDSARARLIQAHSRLQGQLSHECKSGLLKTTVSGEVSLLAIFGGQGSHNVDCLDELRNVYMTYKIYLEDFMKLAASTLERLADNSDSANYPLDAGFDLLNWLDAPESAPDRAQIATAPFSFPINGLISLAHYCVTCRILELDPGQMRSYLAGATGHSQGVVIAAAIAGCDSWEDFSHATDQAISLLFWIGLESHQGTPSSFWAAASPQLAASEEGFVSSMLSVQGLKQKELAHILKDANSHLVEDEKVHLALINSKDKMVVAGPTKMLHGIASLLEETRAPASLDQARVPFPHRRPIIDYQFLPISAAFHSPHLSNAAQKILRQIDLTFWASLSLALPVYHTRTGEDIRDLSNQELPAVLIEMVTCSALDWHKACLTQRTTHILDFGPSRTSNLLHDQIHGSRTRIIFASDMSDASGGKHELLSQEQPLVPKSWSDLYGPNLLRDAAGKYMISTRMSRLFGTPPIMVAGMTPTTVPWDFVSSIMNAGYHVELAGGGYSNANQFEEAIRKLAGSVPPHRGITCNLIYVNPRAMSWQIPLIRRLVSEGLQIEGLTIGAGVPSVEVAKEYIETLGLKHISFKPGSIAAIEQVIDIAESNPSFPIGLQWTGGRAGGHHSYEDFHAPILKTYGLIRRAGNIILTTGSGFGDAQGMLPYLTGTWSEQLGYSRMPFDGLLMGSRMMVAKEAHTSLKVKELIAQTPGTSESDWYKTYTGPAGGVLTVRSEMGEPIHKIANRAVMLWSELDRTVFSIKDPVKRLATLRDRRELIIARLNSDYAKPWFAVDFRGNIVDIEDMTYFECMNRLITLMYVKNQTRWVHTSYQSLFYDFISRVQERLSPIKNFKLNKLFEPERLLADFVQSYPEAETELLNPEDVSFFIGLCKRRGQKPVNFIPRLDENFETWFKKDSLWQMEDLDAVVDQDPERVCIIHGPVAARHSNSTDESVAEILNRISDDMTDSLLSSEAANTTTEAALPRHPCEEPLSTDLAFLEIVTIIHPVQSVYRLKSSPSEAQRALLLRHLLAGNNSWIVACLTDKYITRRGQRFSNPIRSAFVPEKEEVLTLTYHSGKQNIDSLILSRKGSGNNEFYDALEISSTDSERIDITLRAPSLRGLQPHKIEFEFVFARQGPHSGLEDVTEDRQGRIRAFYASRWSIDHASFINATTGSKFSGETVTLSRKKVESFISVISRAQGDYSASRRPGSWVPLDLGIVAAWTALTKPLLVHEVGGDLFRLLHRSNSFELCAGAEPLKIGDLLETSSRINAVTIQPQGKLLEVAAVVERRGEPVMRVNSAFFIQGQFSEDGKSFRSTEEPEMRLTVQSRKIQSLLMSRKWLKIDDPNMDLVGKTLLFKIRSNATFKPTSGLFDLLVTGEVCCLSNSQSPVTIGNVGFSQGSCAGNPVMEFLYRHGSSARLLQPVEAAGWTVSKPQLIQVPNLSKEYSDVSTDRNPIHVCPVLAGFAQLPGPITHGMYTSAIVRRAIEQEVAGSDCSRFRRWHTSFEDFVSAGDVLRIEVQHRSMTDGRMVLDVQVYNHTSNDKVMNAEAEVEQPRTAYLFCGQGSQEKGMGMALYDTDDAAKTIWDRGDQYMFNLYGFSLLELVRNDPKKMTIYFGGTRGRKIRSNYLAMGRKALRNGQEVVVPIIDGLTYESESYTFQDPRGLLFSTQFAQPAISLMNLAEMASLKSRSLVPADLQFAGHSLGEYSALAGCADFMSLESLLSLTFYRGLMMQESMERDAAGNTDFSMVAVNPSRVGKNFTEDNLNLLVRQIASHSGLLLEIVNYNVEQQQYVCAGHLQALWILGQTCDQLACDPRYKARNVDDIRETVLHQVPASSILPQPIELDRGRATVPLNGINVPFHSSYLRGGIDTYREYLKESIVEENIAPDRLVGRFIPNVIGKPFSVDRSYVEEVAQITGSVPLQRMLAAYG